MKWEYKTIVFGTSGFWSTKVEPHELDQICNQMGQDGWELATNTPITAEGSFNYTKSLVLIFKRPTPMAAGN